MTCPLLAGAEGARRKSVNVLILADTAVPPYAEAVRGLVKELGESPGMHTVLSPQMPGPAAEVPAARVIVAVGQDAVSLVHSGHFGQVPAVCTLVFQQDLGEGARGVTLDVNPAWLFSTLHTLFPRCVRFAAVHGTRMPDQQIAAMKAVCGNLQYSFRAIEVDSARAAIREVHELRGAVDAVWCLPDASIYTPESVRSILSASLKTNLLVVGFSPAWTRAGGAAAAWADYEAAGVQTGQLIRKMLAGRIVEGLEPARSCRLALNTQSLRLLGWPAPERELPGVVLMR